MLIILDILSHEQKADGYTVFLDVLHCFIKVRTTQRRFEVDGHGMQIF